MTKLRKRLLFPTVLVVGILMVGILTTSLVSAQDTTYPTVIERLASKFNLNKDDVQKVFEEVRDEHEADMYSKWAERLDDFVAEGKITQDQKEKLLDKHEEVESKIEELKNQNLTRQVRKGKMMAIHDELKSWAETQGINIPYMMFKFVGPGMGHEFGGDFFDKELN